MNRSAPEGFGPRFVALAGLLYAVVYVIFWPRTFTSLDESTYFNMAYALRHGTIYPDVVGLAPVGTFTVGDHLVSKYPLGMPALLAAVSLFGWPVALGTNLLVNLATFGVLAWLLNRNGVPPVFAVLFLFHPTAVLYGRSVMSDPLSGLTILLAFCAVYRGKPMVAGVFLGMAVLVRTPNAVALPAFVLAYFLELRDPPRSNFGRLEGVTWLLLGFAPGALLAFYYAEVIAVGRMGPHPGAFAAKHFLTMFPAYAITFLLVFPGMLLAPALVRGFGRVTISTVTTAFLLLYSFWYWRDRGTNALETFVVGQRYFLAILPLLVFAYGSVIWRLVATWPPRTLRVVGLLGAVLLLGSTVVVHVRHARYLEPLVSVRQALLLAVRPGDLLVTGTLVAKLFHPAWGTRPTCVTGGSPDDVPVLRHCVESAMRQPDPRVLVANWYRPHRADERQDSAILDIIIGTFPTRPVSLGDARVPKELRVVEIVR